MTDRPLVSLLMAAYNNAGFIKAAIDSVKAQTYTNWELLIQDDGSTDGSYELACVLAEGDPRIKVVTHGKNIGYNLTMCAGAARATGEFHAPFARAAMLEKSAIEDWRSLKPIRRVRRTQMVVV